LTRDSIGSKGVMMVKLFYLGLFFLAAFAAVPLILHMFIAGQIRIGNGEVFIIKWLQAHERMVVYCAWGFFALGVGIAFSLARNDILQQLK
jgi:hypothetical protein